MQQQQQQRHHNAPTPPAAQRGTEHEDSSDASSQQHTVVQGMAVMTMDNNKTHSTLTNTNNALLLSRNNLTNIYMQQSTFTNTNAMQPCVHPPVVLVENSVAASTPRVSLSSNTHHHIVQTPTSNMARTPCRTTSNSNNTAAAGAPQQQNQKQQQPHMLRQHVHHHHHQQQHRDSASSAVSSTASSSYATSINSNNNNNSNRSARTSLILSSATAMTAAAAQHHQQEQQQHASKSTTITTTTTAAAGGSSSSSSSSSQNNKPHHHRGSRNSLVLSRPSSRRLLFSPAAQPPAVPASAGDASNNGVGQHHQQRGFTDTTSSRNANATGAAGHTVPTSGRVVAPNPDSAFFGGLAGAGGKKRDSSHAVVAGCRPLSPSANNEDEYELDDDEEESLGSESLNSPPCVRGSFNRVLFRPISPANSYDASGGTSSTPQQSHGSISPSTFLQQQAQRPQQQQQQQEVPKQRDCDTPSGAMMRAMVRRLSFPASPAALAAQQPLAAVGGGGPGDSSGHGSNVRGASLEVGAVAAASGAAAASSMMKMVMMNGVEDDEEDDRMESQDVKMLYGDDDGGIEGQYLPRSLGPIRRTRSALAFTSPDAPVLEFEHVAALPVAGTRQNNMNAVVSAAQQQQIGRAPHLLRRSATVSRFSKLAHAPSGIVSGYHIAMGRRSVSPGGDGHVGTRMSMALGAGGGGSSTVASAAAMRRQHRRMHPYRGQARCVTPTRNSASASPHMFRSIPSRPGDRPTSAQQQQHRGSAVAREDHQHHHQHNHGILLRALTPPPRAFLGSKIHRPRPMHAGNDKAFQLPEALNITKLNVARSNNVGGSTDGGAGMDVDGEVAWLTRATSPLCSSVGDNKMSSFVGEGGIRFIHCATLRKLLLGEMAHLYDRVIVIDTRYPYEYEGGHIRGALSVWRELHLRRMFFPGQLSSLSSPSSPGTTGDAETGFGVKEEQPFLPPLALSDEELSAFTDAAEMRLGDVLSHQRQPHRFAGNRVCIVLHCEYSQKRGPSRCFTVRDHDRSVNFARHSPSSHTPSVVSSVPALTTEDPVADANEAAAMVAPLSYPELYCLHGGYKLFFETFPDLCIPRAHVSELDMRFRLARSELRSLGERWV